VREWKKPLAVFGRLGFVRGMNDVAKPLVYVILGASGSGRREILADLITDGLDTDEQAVVLLAEDEAADERDAKLGKIVRWRLLGAEAGIEVPEGALDGATHVFFVTDGRGNPVDQLEAFKVWVESSGAEMARVFTVVDCQLAEKHKALIAWYEACIHFSDVVLLTKREGVANKWMSDFQTLFKDKFYPALFEMVKAGRVKNPPLLLEPEARRMSHLFDEPDWVVDGVDAEEMIETGEDDAEVGTKLNEEVEVTQAVDPYMERRLGGRRMIEIPDVAKFLG
jgi:hypothetical protein